MISLSPDGEFIAKTGGLAGLPGHPRLDPAPAGPGTARAAAGAFMEALDLIAGGGGVIITPDGPRGPGEVMPAGPVMLAKRAETRGLSGRHRGPAGDQAEELGQDPPPLPFARGCAVLEGPLRVPAARRPGRAGGRARRLAGQA